MLKAAQELTLNFPFGMSLNGVETQTGFILALNETDTMFLLKQISHKG